MTHTLQYLYWGDLCIKYAVTLVTASYISAEMQELNSAAIEANIPILCEMGLDPGMVRVVSQSVCHHDT